VLEDRELLIVAFPPPSSSSFLRPPFIIENVPPSQCERCVLPMLAPRPWVPSYVNVAGALPSHGMGQWPLTTTKPLLL